ncbi:MAG: SUMF1/EgtB/PvdO family nonheme iron enzyme [Polyangiaceae bacterium]
MRLGLVMSVTVVLASCDRASETKKTPGLDASTITSASASSVPSQTTSAPVAASVSAASSVAETPVSTLPTSSGACPAGMLLVDGEFCPTLLHRCVDWIDEEKDRCRAYAPDSGKCFGKPKKLRFCIDKYEYPNLEGVKPAVMPDWHDAKDACEIEGKRLCQSSEWTLACEGPEHTPYPYGWVRDTTACNIDRPRPTPEPDFEAFSHPRRIMAEVDRLDLRVKSGELPACVSKYGVHDMTGNVDEWVVNEKHFEPTEPGKKKPYISGLKGGYWGPIRARCRPATTSHNEWFRFYQVGFRCCADARPGGG